MPPKKAQKMSLNEFLGDNALGSWADEMDSLPTAPAARGDDDRGMNDRGRRDDYMTSRPDRGPFREDLPLPTEPPYTAFIGNLAFDLTESELEDFFGGAQTKSVKIIKDREEKPKGFGYIEFVDLDGLKDALTKSGSNVAGRTIRVSVAEPPKERSGFGGGFDDDAKFSGNWRRDGPLPDLASSREGSHRRDGPPPSSMSDNASDWRSSRVPSRSSTATPLDSDPGAPSFKRRGSGFREGGPPPGAADTEETWQIGSKFKPSVPPSEAPGSRFGSMRGRDVPPARDTLADEGEWRRPQAISRNSTSPNNSTPPTPQLTRRKLELLPRSGGGSTPSPLSSPNPANPSSHRSNPFGAAKPVDVSAKEQAVADRLEKEREVTKERITHSMSRTSSRTASQRERDHARPDGPASSVGSPSSPQHELLKSPTSGVTANVRPSISFANAAAGKKDERNGADVDEVAEGIDEVQI
ncbi:hypothetical protein B0H21DRAFT_753305 [Amylocystis lapponica]|nr:hypothetical protein B0H21DRAFT_753305 [Amylocystis lapponica]